MDKDGPAAIMAAARLVADVFGRYAWHGVTRAKDHYELTCPALGLVVYMKRDACRDLVLALENDGVMVRQAGHFVGQCFIPKQTDPA